VADVAALHQALVDGLVARGWIRSAGIEAAFRAVPRHLFLPGVEIEEIYRDQWIVTKRLDGEAVSSSSQPQIMAVMLEQLGLEPGHRTMEIGAGTGDNAALMAHVTGEAGEVITVDIDPDLVEGAREHLAAAGLGRVRVVCADGGLGHPERAPYDRIILTVGAWDLAPAWREQLRPGGRLVVPVTVGGVQKSVGFERAHDHLVSVSVKDCLFMPLRGAFAGPRTRLPLGPPGLNLWPPSTCVVDAAAFHMLLGLGGQDLPLNVRVTAGEAYGGLIPWLALHEAGFCWLEAEGPDADATPVPGLFASVGRFRSSAGLLDGGAACFLARADAESEPFEVVARVFGNGVALAHRVLDRVAEWDAAGRPGTRGLRIRVYPLDGEYQPAAGELTVTKRWNRFVLDWPDHAPPGAA
jgi:protein-L-isoaspartate(D-aspartate) O-methyltransferase